MEALAPSYKHAYHSCGAQEYKLVDSLPDLPTIQFYLQVNKNWMVGRPGNIAGRCGADQRLN